MMKLVFKGKVFYFDSNNLLISQELFIYFVEVHTMIHIMVLTFNIHSFQAYLSQLLLKLKKNKERVRLTPLEENL